MGRDDAQKIYLEISSPKFNPPSRFYINYPITYNIGSDPMSDIDRSKAALAEFIDFIKPSGEFSRYIEKCKHAAAAEEPIRGNSGGYNNTSVSASEDPLKDQMVL